MQLFLSSSTDAGILRSMDARVKLLWMLAIAFLSVALRDPLLLLLLFVSTWPFWLILSRTGRKYKKCCCFSLS